MEYINIEIEKALCNKKDTKEEQEKIKKFIVNEPLEAIKEAIYRKIKEFISANKFTMKQIKDKDKFDQTLFGYAYQVASTFIKAEYIKFSFFPDIRKVGIPNDGQVVIQSIFPPDIHKAILEAYKKENWSDTFFKEKNGQTPP